MRWRFGRFQLDRESACLWEGEQRLTLRPKTFELLVYLVEHAGELVRKETLSRWSGRTPSWRMGAHDEHGRTPQGAWGDGEAATVHCHGTRRGYRFIAPVTPGRRPGPCLRVHIPSLPPPPLSPSPPPLLVNREAETAWLHQWFRGASTGNATWSLSRVKRGLGRRPWWTPFWHRLRRDSRWRWGVVSALTIMGLGKPICRCWKRLGRWDRPPTGPTCSKCSASRRQAGCCNCRRCGHARVAHAPATGAWCNAGADAARVRRGR